MRHAKRWRPMCAIAAFLALAFGGRTPRLFAQTTTEGAIGGLVLDQSKATIPGATVTARNVATNAAGEATTDVSGRFQVIHLAPGVYNVEVTLAGFAPYKQNNVVVEVGRSWLPQE